MKEEQRHLNEECKRLRSDAEQQRQEKENLGQGNHELDRNLSRLQSRIDLLEQEKVRLTENLKSRDDKIEDLTESKKNLELELQEKKLLVTKRETTVKKVSQELIKANDIIRKLQVIFIMIFYFYIAHSKFVRFCPGSSLLAIINREAVSRNAMGIIPSCLVICLVIHSSSTSVQPTSILHCSPISSYSFSIATGVLDNDTFKIVFPIRQWH